MDPSIRDGNSYAPGRPPRRADTLPVRFAERDHIEIIERDPGLRRRQSRVAEEDSIQSPLRRQGSSFRVQRVDDRRDEPIHERHRGPHNPQRRGSRDTHSTTGHGHRKRRGRVGSLSDSGSGSEESEIEEPMPLDDLPVDDDQTGSDDESESSYRSRSRSRGHRHIRRSHYHSDSDSEDEDESDVNRDAYDFSLPRYSKGPLSQDSTLAGSEPSLKTESESVSQFSVGSPKVGTTKYVYSSQYVGEGSIAGAHKAQLNALHDSKKSQTPLFRWIHFEDPSMHFEDFQNGVARIPTLTDIERTGLTKVLRRARKKYDKPLQTAKGTKVRFMEPGFLQEALSRGDRPKEKASRLRTVTWLCIPYFCLEGYSGVRSASRPGAHPMRTLLQARFSLVRKERDMQQAVRSIVGTPEGFCFHIAQIWCVVLDDSLLVTCARVPMSALRGDLISMTSGPMPEQPKGKTPKILVHYGASLLWSFRADDCPTWFAFLSHFWEFWPRRFRILHGDKVLSAELWPRVLNLAKHMTSNIHLNFQLGSTHKPTTRGVSNASEQSFIPGVAGATAATSSQENPTKASQGPVVEPSNEGDEAQPRSDETTEPSNIPNDSISGAGFYVLTWMNTGKSDQVTENLSVNEKQLRDDLERMDRYLSHKTNFVERISYKECPQISILQIESVLREEVKVLASSALKKDEKKWTSLEQRLLLCGAAKTIFEFFLPYKFEGPTVLKYWGAVHRLLVETSPDRPRDPRKDPKKGRRKQESRVSERDLSDIIDDLELIVRHVQPFKDLMSQAEPVDRAHIDVPEELFKAWLHLVMALSFTTSTSNAWGAPMDIASDLIDQGMKKMVLGLTQKSLLEKSVLMPLEVASLVNFQFLQDITGVHPDIIETYSEYLKGLEADIESNPVERAHQDKITLLKQEIAVIRGTLNDQNLVCLAILVAGQNRSSKNKKDSSSRSYANKRDEDYRTSSWRNAATHPDYDEAYSSRIEPGTYVSRQDAEVTVMDNTDPSSMSQLSPTDPGGYRELLAQECFDITERRIRDVDEMNEKAADLATENLQKLSTYKDRQESAIYAFTIVTIIFLPLSTVAGILGMNTIDIRETNIKQWVFWAVAIPLTTIIVVLCLIWAGELENFWTGFTNLWRRNPGRGFAPPLPDRYSPVTRYGIERAHVPLPPLSIQEEVPYRDRMRTVSFHSPPERERRDVFGNSRIGMNR